MLPHGPILGHSCSTKEGTLPARILNLANLAGSWRDPSGVTLATLNGMNTQQDPEEEPAPLAICIYYGADYADDEEDGQFWPYCCFHCYLNAEEEGE